MDADFYQHLFNTGKIKICPTCNLVKSVSAYAKDRSRTDGLNNYCRECDNARNRDYRKKVSLRSTLEDRRTIISRRKATI